MREYCTTSGPTGNGIVFYKNLLAVRKDRVSEDEREVKREHSKARRTCSMQEEKVIVGMPFHFLSRGLCSVFLFITVDLSASVFICNCCLVFCSISFLVRRL